MVKKCRCSKRNFDKTRDRETFGHLEVERSVLRAVWLFREHISLIPVSGTLGLRAKWGRG